MFIRRLVECSNKNRADQLTATNVIHLMGASHRAVHKSIKIAPFESWKIKIFMYFYSYIFDTIIFFFEILVPLAKIHARCFFLKRTKYAHAACDALVLAKKKRVIRSYKRIYMHLIIGTLVYNRWPNYRRFL